MPPSWTLSPWAHRLSAESEEDRMNECTIYPSINNHNRYAIGSPDGRELERGEAVEILLGGFRVPGFIEDDSNGGSFKAMTGPSICGFYAGIKGYLTTLKATEPYCAAALCYE